MFVLVHFLCLLDDFLPVAVGGRALLLCFVCLERLVFLRLEAGVCCVDTHRAGRELLAKTEVALVEHVDCQLHRLRAEVYCSLSVFFIGSTDQQATRCKAIKRSKGR